MIAPPSLKKPMSIEVIRVVVERRLKVKEIGADVEDVAN